MFARNRGNLLSELPDVYQVGDIYCTWQESTWQQCLLLWKHRKYWIKDGVLSGFEHHSTWCYNLPFIGFISARLFTTRNHKDTTMYHKDTTRNHKDTTMYHKDTTRNLSFYHKDTPCIPRGTMTYPRDTQWNFKVPQGLPGVLSHVYIKYHKESLEYSAMSI
jgi:hypothetical protein